MTDVLDMEKLLPCPHCKGDVTLTRVDFPDGDVEWVFDCKCGRKIFDVSGKRQAILAWNTRC